MACWIHDNRIYCRVSYKQCVMILIYTTNAKADVIADKFASHFISAFSCNDPQKANSVKQDYVCMRDCGLPLCTPCFTGPRVHTTQPKRHLDRFTQYKADCPRTCVGMSFPPKLPSACHNLHIHLIDRVKWRHISVVAIRSPSYSAYGGEDLSRYWNARAQQLLRRATVWPQYAWVVSGEGCC